MPVFKSKHHLASIAFSVILPWTAFADDTANAVARAIHAISNPDTNDETRVRAIHEIGAMGEIVRQSAPVLAGALGQGEPDVQRAVLRALEQMGPSATDAVPALIDLLRQDSTSGYLKFTVMETLAAIGPGARDAVPALLESLENLDESQERLIYAIAHALGKIRDPRAIPPLLDRKQFQVLDEFAPESIPVLIQNLDHEDDDEARRTAQALSRIGSPAIPALIEALSSESTPVREGALQAFYHMRNWHHVPGPDVIPDIQPLLQDPSPEIRESAVQFLMQFKKDAQPVLDPIIRLLNDPSEKVRQTAALALFHIPGSEKALPALIGLLKDPDEEVRAYAAGSLPIAENPQRVLSLLMDLLEDSSPMVRRFAAGAIGMLGEDAVAAIPDLIALFGDPNDQVRTVASIALSGYSVAPGIGEASLDALRQALKSDQANVRFQAIVSLGWLGELACPAVPDLIRAMDDGDEKVIRQAISALGRIRSCASPAVPKLMDQLRNGSPQIAGAAVETLGLIQDPASVPALTGYLSARLDNRDDSTSERDPLIRTTVRALARFGPEAKDSVRHLIRILNGNHRRFVQSDTIDALARIGSPEALEALAHSLKSEDLQLRMDVLQSMPEWDRADFEIESIIRFVLDSSTDQMEKLYAAWALAKMDPENEEPIGRLIAFLHSKDSRVEQEATRALGDLGERAKAAVFSLTAKVEKGTPFDLQGRAMESLRQIGSPYAVPAMMPRVRNPDSRFRLGAAWCVVSIARRNPGGAVDPEAVAMALDALNSALWSKEPGDRGMAAEALGDLKAQESAPRLRELLKDPAPYVRTRAANALKGLDQAE